MDQSHLLSIIIPAYNAGAYIEQCISSILELKIPKEVIIVDDGSTDDTIAKVIKFTKKDEVILFKQYHGGVSIARNHGLSKCKGDIVAFVDSDDYIIANGFEELYNQFIFSDAVMAIGGVKIIFSDDKIEQRQAYIEMLGKIILGQNCFAQLLRSDTFVPLVFNYLFRKSFIEEKKMLFNHRLSEDDLWTTTAMCQANNVYISDSVHYVYRKHNNSITSNNVNSRFKADNLMAVGHDMYSFLISHSIIEETRNWLCCKILHIYSTAIKIYVSLGDTYFDLNYDVVATMVRFILSSSEIRLKRIGITYYLRINNMLNNTQ